MRRVFLTLFSTFLLSIMSAIPLPAAALGEVQAKLACSDGTTTDMSVDTEALAGLRDAVEAMTLYPAGLSCTLSTSPLLGSFGANVAQAAGGTDFVVGGGQRAAFCDTNIAINGHRQSGVASDAWGVVNQTIPGDAACGLEGIMRTEVVCVQIFPDLLLGDVAVVGAYIKTSTGVFDSVGYKAGTYIDWYFREGKAGTANPPEYGNSLPDVAPCSTGPVFNDTLQHGRILIKEHA